MVGIKAKSKSIFSIYLIFSALSISAQDIVKGKFCLSYFPQPSVENYIDSLANYLRTGFADENGNLDSITLQYIDHFTGVPLRKSKCISFNRDSILVEELVGEVVNQAYLVVPAQNEMLSKREGEVIAQPFILEEGQSDGHMDFFVREVIDDTKVIEGFPCHRLEIKEVFYPAEDGEPREKDYVLYVTDRIKVPGGVILGNNMKQEIPCPLEVQEPLGPHTTISYRAQGMRFSLAPNTFSL